jgi:hypothetical protein
MKVNLKKTGFKKVMVAVLTAIMGLTGCISDEIVESAGSSGNSSGTNSDLKSVMLKVAGKLPETRSASDVPATRSAGNSVASSQTVTFNGGWLLFVSEQNNVTKVMEITTTNTGAISDSQVEIALLTQAQGVEIPDVPGHSRSVYVIGNLPAGAGIVEPAVGVSLTALKQNLIGVSTQRDINNVTLFGGDAIKVESAKNVARFELKPLVARIEIAKISSTNNSDITSFKLEGIFINSYYDTVMLNGNAPADVIKNTEVAGFARGSAAYPAAYDGILYDYRSAQGQSLGTASAPNIHVPSASQSAWVYNLLAPVACAQPNTLAAPHIVIAVSDIQTQNGTEYKDTWYLTVTSLVHQGSKITRLEPGKVYSIKDINFSHTNVQPEPEMKTMEVEVEVTLVEWDILETDVIFGQD